MFDYAAWIDRARRFVGGIESLAGEANLTIRVAPPLTVKVADDLAASLPMGLPSVLRDFLTQGSADCECTYWWQPPAEKQEVLKELFAEDCIYGGPVLCDASDLADLQQSRSDWADGFDERDPDDDQEDDSGLNYRLWRRCTPLARLANGDRLAVDTTINPHDPPVVYLGHDSDSFVIAPTFAEFLRHWEALRYIGPEHWVLRRWLRYDDGMIDSENQRTPILRQLFAP